MTRPPETPDTGAPAVVAWSLFGRHGDLVDLDTFEPPGDVVAHFDRHNASRAPHTVVPLVRLSDWEALAARCEALERRAESAESDWQASEARSARLQAEHERLRGAVEKAISFGSLIVSIGQRRGLVDVPVATRLADEFTTEVRAALSASPAEPTPDPWALCEKHGWSSCMICAIRRASPAETPSYDTTGLAAEPGFELSYEKAVAVGKALQGVATSQTPTTDTELRFNDGMDDDDLKPCWTCGGKGVIPFRSPIPAPEPSDPPLPSPDAPTSETPHGLTDGERVMVLAAALRHGEVSVLPTVAENRELADVLTRVARAASRERPTDGGV